ncbi:MULTISPECIES: apolipoprotein N-acyltransferase [unclassified Aureimonas]|uniref:apolipoprotein N-acyltransferase n=1 Tax=unclassified Aureimonas TaxID=2615206 RepID=UPI0007017FEC|nr:MULTISPECIES: apolipoprotein N-acyltransferase [unclassified Aureimonas]KQT64316.1 acyltransferase [Aureimonas sp. Leaf427]KQT81505.1 acyltransferase [Aureimonas sp. Leaf460]
MLRNLAASMVLADGWRRALLAFFAGAVLVLGLPPFNLPLAGFVGFPILVLLLDGAAGVPGHGVIRRLGPAFRIGWFFGFGYFVAGLWWLGAAMLVDGDEFIWALPFAVLGLPAILALFFAAAAAAARLLWSEGTGRILALAASFALFEVLRGRLFTGFSWNEIGIIAAPVPLLMQSLAEVGLHGLTLAAVYVFAAPALLLDPRPRPAGLAVAGLLVLAHVGYGLVRLAAAEPGDAGVALRIVQPNILQSQKWDAAEAERIFDRLIELTGQRPAPPDGAPANPDAKTIVLWPESSLPFLLTERPDALARIAEVLQPNELLLAGAVRVEPAGESQEPRYYNSVLAIDGEGQILDAADKVHLVPFGEYLPFQETLEASGIRQLTDLPGGFSAGARPRALEIVGWPVVLPLICYEIIFQDEVDRSLVARAGAIVNVTNDAWYGRTPGPYQHLRQAELTAVALGLPLVRAANTGISVVTDAYGRTREALALGSTGIVTSELTVRSPSTHFAIYENRPFWIGWAAVLMVCVGLRWFEWRNERLTV